MSGQKGQNGPHYLKCSQCKKKRDENGYARRGEMVRTGRTRGVSNIRGCGGLRVATELRCLMCNHRGFYTHRDAPRAPLDTY